MYIVTATRYGLQVPTFFIDENIQGCLTETDVRIVARRIVCNANLDEQAQVHVHVEKLHHSEIMRLCNNAEPLLHPLAAFKL